MTRAQFLLVFSVAGAPLAAQSEPAAGDVAAFVATVRASTERYRDRAAAIADGYRRIGPDFPSMGEHWVSVPLVVRGEVDPRHPPILEYVTVDGAPVLAGVAYTQLVRDRQPSAPLPAPASAWHYHAGSVSEESFILGHARGGEGREPDRGPRVAVLHAWVWLENPAGLFATDNWALPWHRLGITPPPGSAEPTPAGLAAALATGGRDYFLTLLRLREGLSDKRTDRIAAVLDRKAQDWRTRLQAVADRGLPMPAAELSEAWTALEGELRRICADCTISPRTGHH
jgi:hypothetical protein